MGSGAGGWGGFKDDACAGTFASMLHAEPMRARATVIEANSLSFVPAWTL